MQKELRSDSATHKSEGIMNKYEEIKDHMKKYDEIINLPPHVSPTRKRMSLYNRAAQFAPFSALKGHDEAIEETEQSHLENFNTATPTEK